MQEKGENVEHKLTWLNCWETNLISIQPFLRGGEGICWDCRLIFLILLKTQMMLVKVFDYELKCVHILWFSNFITQNGDIKKRNKFKIRNLSWTFIFFQKH